MRVKIKQIAKLSLWYIYSYHLSIKRKSQLLSSHSSISDDNHSKKYNICVLSDYEDAFGWKNVKFRHCKDVKLRDCNDVKHRGCNDVKFRGCNDVKFRGCNDWKLRGCNDAKLRNWKDVKLRGCNYIKIRHCNDVKLVGL